MARVEKRVRLFDFNRATLKKLVCRFVLCCCLSLVSLLVVCLLPARSLSRERIVYNRKSACLGSAINYTRLMERLR